MEKYFKTYDGKYINIVKHTLEQLNKWPDLKIYISTDSQSFSSTTRYATCIVYRYGTRGAHYVVFKEEVPRFARADQEFTRLYEEGTRTLATAKILQDELSIFPVMEFDYANEKQTLSTKMVAIFKGYTNSVFKGGEMIASKAADHECRTGANIFNLEAALKQAA